MTDERMEMRLHYALYKIVLHIKSEVTGVNDCVARLCSDFQVESLPGILILM